MTEEVKDNEKKIIKEVCLAGACNRGICYIGCFKKLEENELLKMEKVVGVSIGAFIAACYIIGYKSDELLDMIIEKDMKQLRDISFSEQGAVLKGEQYRKWVYEVLNNKVNPNITLKELYDKTKVHFIIPTTCLHSSDKEFQEGLVNMSYELTPTISLITAITCSMAFPFIFPPVNYNNTQFIDGGILDNFPLGILSEDALGLKVNFKEIDGATSTHNPIIYVGKIFEIITNRFKYLDPIINENVVCTMCDDFSLIDFEMTIDDKITLYKRGYTTMEKYLKKT